MNPNHYKILIDHSTFGFARLKVILNSSDNTYDFEIEEVNPAFETITGVSEKLAIGGGLSVFFDDTPDEAAQKQALFRQLLLENKSVETELFAHKLDRWLRISASPAGQSHIDLLFSDITPRMQAEDKFTTAFRLAPHSMTINCFKTGMFVDVNDAFLKVTGYSYEDIIGKSATELGLWANPSDRDKVIADLKKGKEVRVREYMFKNCKGEQLHGLYSASVIQINNKPHILTSIEDITERKNAQLALEAEHKKMNAVVSAMPDMIFIMNRKGKILDIYGPKPEKLLAPADNLIGCTLQKLFPEKEAERHLELYKQCIQNNETGLIEFELIINEKPTFFESHIRPLDNERLLTVVRDISEARKMQETIKEELAFRNFLFESDREGLLIMSNDHQVIDANNKICEMLGYSYEEVLQLFTWDLDALNSREKILSNFDNSRDVDTRFESLHQRKDGSTYNVEVSARSFWWKNERLVFCACRDISDRKKLERQTIEAKNLAETNHKRFEEIAAHTGEFIWEVDAGGLYTYANSACQSILGYSPEEMVGKMTFADLLPEIDRPPLTKAFNELAAQKSVIVNLENTMISKDGRTVYAVTNGIPRIGEDGQLIGYRGSDRDITKQYEAEEKLKENEKKYRLMVENVSDVLFTLKPDGTISYMSPAVKTLSGFEADDYVGKHFSQFIHKDDLEGIANDFEQLKTGNYYPSEYRINTINGSEVWVRSSTKAVNENTYSGIARDITNEKESAKALKDSEAQYRMLFNANLDSLSIVYIEPDGGVSNFVEINDAGAGIIGYTREELLRKSPSDIEVGTSTEKVGERIKQLQESGMAVFETIMRNKKGENRNMEIKAMLINYGNRPAILNISRDITERKKAEIALKESEKFAFTVANSTPALLYIYNIEKQQNVWSNEAHKKYFSNIFDDTSGLYSSDIEKIIHPNDFRHTQTLLHNMLADNNKQQMNAEVRIGEKGSWSWMNLMLSKFKTDENGYTIEILGALFDIDERKKAEEELMLKNSNTAFLNNLAIKMANIQLSTDVGKAIIPDIKKHTGAIYAMHTHFDREKHAFFINHIEAESKIINAVMKIAGEEVLNKPSKLSIENYRKVAVSNVNVYRSINELTFGDVPEIVSKAIGAITGVTQIYGLVHVVGDRIYGGTVLGFGKNQPLPSEDMLRSYAYLMAITLRRNFAEQELIKAKEAAEESNRLKSAFLASISHELRTPLNHVIGFSDLIKSEVTDPEIYKYASIIFDSGTNFLTMIEDILALALSEQTEIKLRMQSFKGMDLFLENRNLLHEILQNAGKTEDIKLQFKPEASVLASVFTSDRLKINQVLTNLFKNAVKYTHQGSITFGMRQEDEETLMLYVTDTGIGIAKDKLDIIFDFFRQGDDTHTRLYGGLGLGLAISQRIANIMGASLRVTSEPGKGSTFYFSIPVGFIGDMGAYEKDHNQIKLPDLRNHTLLIAEDDEDSMMMITALLKPTNAKLLCASNGQEAVSIFEQNMDIELVLMDIKMPVMDGLQATRIIKQRFPDLPVIALTAFNLLKDRLKAEDAGCDKVLTKPVDKKRLYNTLMQFFS